FKISYQNTIFNKVFKNVGILSVIEFLDLENKPLSIVSFCYLLQFCYEHNEKILEGIEKPVFLENTKKPLQASTRVTWPNHETLEEER
ncbi:MAG: hypothetical protein WCO51_10165, partial [bacterium]